MSADLYTRTDVARPSQELDRVLRRRSTDRDPQLRTREDDVNQLLADIATRSVSDPDMVDILRRRADGSLDVVKLTPEQAVLLGLMKPTRWMRLKLWWKTR